jgi:hypothetical protein
VLRQPIDGERGHVVGPERYDQQHAERWYLVHDATEQFEACGSAQCASSKIINIGFGRDNATT